MTIYYVHAKLDKLLITTLEGDVIEVLLKELDERNIVCQRINSIIKIEGNVNTLSVISDLDQILTYGGESQNISMINLNSNEPSDFMNIGKTITCMDSVCMKEGGFTIAIGCSTGEVFIRHNWENDLKKYSIFGEKSVTEVRFGQDDTVMVVCTQDRDLHLLKLNFEENEYQKVKSIKTQEGYPTACSFDAEFSKLLILTSNWKFTVVNLGNFQISSAGEEDLSNSFWVNFDAKFLMTPKSNSLISNSVILGKKHNFVISSDELSNFHMWKNPFEINQNCGQIFKVHSSHIQNMKITSDDEYIISAGYNDQMICKWKVQSLINDQNAIIGQVDKTTTVSTMSQEIEINDIYLISELNYSYYEKSDKESVDNNISIRGFLNANLNNIFSRNQTTYESETSLLATPACLILDYLYGSHICERRNSVVYLHTYDNNKNEFDFASLKKKEGNAELVRKILNEEYEKKSINDIIRMLNFSELKKGIVHNYCSKNIIYFNSRFIIIFNPNKTFQKIYQGHKNKVSCLAINNENNIIASGEVSSNPKIYIWKIDTFETVKLLRTGHSNGILHLAFSNKGTYLLSIGFGMIYTIQIFCVNLDYSPIFMNISQYPIFFVKFFNSTENKFITLGYHQIIIWKIKGNTLTKVKHVESEEYKLHDKDKSSLTQKIFLCADFLDYQLGNSIETDIIMGSNFGDITGVSCNKYILLKSSAHAGSINCIKVTDQLKERKYIILTAGEDSLLKIWDQFYNTLRIIDIFKVNVLNFGKDFTEMHRGIQSLDLYGCDKGKLFILIGVRSGDLVEIEISNPLDLINTQGESSLLSGLDKKEMSVSYKLLYSYPYTLSLNLKSNRVIFSVHPSLPVVVLASVDQTLRIYDFERKEIIITKNLGSAASCISFSPDGKLLAIGMIYGKVMIVNSEMPENTSGMVGISTNSYSGSYFPPTLEPIQFIQYSSNIQGITPVLLAKFSQGGDFLAISYDNKRSKDGKPQGGSLVSIYMLRLSKKLQLATKKTISNDLYLKYCDITMPDNQYQLTNLSKMESATTAIDFSDDSLFVLLTHQQVGFSRESASKEAIFIVWDLNKNQITINPEKLRMLNFPKFTTSCAIYARTLKSLYSDKTENIDPNSSVPVDNIIFSSIWQSVTSPFCIAGNSNGNLFTFRSSAFVFDSEMLLNYSIDKMELNKMAVSRPFSAHCGSVSKLESTTNERFMFTSSTSDQCVIQWFVMVEDCFWDLDFFPIPHLTQDPFMDLLTKEIFDLLYEEVWLKRNQLIDIYNSLGEEEGRPNLNIDLVNIHGRRACDRRNNLKYDNSNRIIYNVSSYIVFLSRDSVGKLRQEFLLPEDNFSSNVQMEVSSFCLSMDKREMAIGFNGATACISIWEINTQMNIGKIEIPHCSVVHMLKFSYNKSKIIGVGIHRNYYVMIFLVDILMSEVIASSLLIHTLPCKIKDIEFAGDTCDEFYTVGIQHLAIWMLRGKHLEYRNIPLKMLTSTVGQSDIDKETNLVLDENKYGIYLLLDDTNKIDSIAKVLYRENPDAYIKVSFLNIATFKQFAILSGDDGNLYTLEQVDLTTKRKFHNGPITALEKNEEMKFLLSGSMDGRIILYKVDSPQNLKISKIFRTFEENMNIPMKEVLSTADYNVQAIGLGMNKIAVGTRSGNILEFQITDDLQIINPNTLNAPIGVVNFQDHDPPISIAIDNSSTKFFAITSKGKLSIWNLINFSLTYSFDFKVNAKYIYHFKYQNKLLIAFENYISVLDTSDDSSFPRLPVYDLQAGEINDVKISPNERLLAVASLISNSNPVLDIYDIVNGFVHKNQVQNLNSKIKYLDFSKESNFILLEDYLEEVLVIDIHSKKVVSSPVCFDIEWLGDGLKYSVKFKSVHTVFENIKTIKIVRHPQIDLVAVGDELGSVRFFKYPSSEDDKFFACKTDHTGKINNLLFSFDNKYFITSSEYDKAVFIYRINNSSI